MSDEDKFKLGNFGGISDDNDDDDKEGLLAADIDDLDDLEIEDDYKPGDAAEKIDKDLDRIESKKEAEGEVNLPSNDIRTQEVADHPTEKADPQARFGGEGEGSERFTVIEIEKIIPNEFQPRRIFDPEKLRELADSIREHGIIQPLVVVSRDDGKYEIIVGERRYRAAKIAGLEKVPVFLSKKLEPKTKLELALIENVQRADLNPIEEAKAYQQLREEFEMSLEEIAKRVGKNSSTISNLIRLLRLPAQIQRALVEGQIAEGQARPILSLKTPEEMLQMYEIIRRNDMKVRDIEKKVREIKERKIKVKEMFTPDPFLESLENLLRNKFGTRVVVNKKAKGGDIKIEFYSEEELNNIIDKLT